LRRSIVFGPLVSFTPRQKTSTRNPQAKTVLPEFRYSFRQFAAQRRLPGTVNDEHPEPLAAMRRSSRT
jgi:hypothetical protein